MLKKTKNLSKEILHNYGKEYNEMKFFRENDEWK